METLSHLDQKIPHPCPGIMKSTENIRGLMQNPLMLCPLNILYYAIP